MTLAVPFTLNVAAPETMTIRRGLADEVFAHITLQRSIGAAPIFILLSSGS